MNKAKMLMLLVLFFLIGSYTILFAQEVSEKRDIAIFKLSYYDWSIPNEVLGSIDSQIRGVFVNLGRFNVMAMTYQLGSRDVNTFINKIKEFKEKSVKIPEEVAMGHAIFTEADLNQLISSFIVIIPAVTYYDLKTIRDADGYFKEYRTTMRTSFTVLNVDTMIMEKEILIETSGANEDRDKALRSAIDDIASRLVFEVKSVPIFTLKTGILEIYPGGITLQMGKDMGIMPGYEFVILEEQVLKSGHKRVTETGLVIVNKADEEVSEATVLYGEPREGDQLKEVPRVGVEVFPYMHSIAGISAEGLDMSTFTVGFRSTLALGVYSIRPFVGIELPLTFSSNEAVATAMSILWLFGTPMTAYIGVEYTMYLGRIQIAPALAIGGSGVYNSNSDPVFQLTHLGGMAYLSASYLITRDLKLAFDVGYAYWYAPNQLVFYSYDGVMIGAGLIIKL